MMNLRFLFPVLLFPFTLVLGAEKEYDHVFFDNSVMSGRYFFSKADYSGNSYLRHIQHKLPVSFDNYFTAKNSLLLDYISADHGAWSASIIYPDWRGKDHIQSGQYLDFRIYTESPVQTGEFPEIAVGKFSRRDTTISSFIPFESYISKNSTGKWKLVHIPLSVFKNLTYNHSKEIRLISFRQASKDGKEHRIYLDQIEIVPADLSGMQTLEPVHITAKAYDRHVDISWDKPRNENLKYIKIYRSEGKRENFQAVGIQDPDRGRYVDFTGETGKTYKYKVTCVDRLYKETPYSNAATATTYPMTDEQLLNMVQEASFRYYWEGAEANSGLALENIPGRTSMIAAGASGFGIMATLVGTERGFITRKQATDRFTKILNYLEKADRFHGAYAHFMNGETGKVEPFFGKRDNGADLVETAFLFQGLLAARQYFSQPNPEEKAIREKITKLWEGIEWDWFKRTPDNKYLLWHWSPDQEWVINHSLIGWNETMIVYLLAIASPTHGVDKSMYYSGWASQEEKAQKYRSSWGQTHDGEKYSNGNTYFGIKLDVGVSTGGPLFFLHYSYMGFDPHGIKDKFTEKDYFNTFRNIALINYRYCVENPKKQLGYGPDCWGLTASDDPWDYRAAEATEHGEDGTIAPTGALASFPYTPDLSMEAFKNYYFNYGNFLWGEYGFRDAFNLNENWCANIYMGLNQAPVSVMIENYRSGLIWKLFMSNPEIKGMVGNLFEKTQ